jgi:hypothetical protein
LPFNSPYQPAAILVGFSSFALWPRHDRRQIATLAYQPSLAPMSTSSKSGGSNKKYSAQFPLHTAANEGDLDKVKILIQQYVLIFAE